MSKKVCLITGVGPGTGTALVRRFSELYEVAMLARDGARLEALAEEIKGAHSYPCDVSNTDQLQQTLSSIVAD